VTNEELAKKIGEQLLLHRNRLHWTPREVRKHGGPVGATVDDIDHGALGNWDKIAAYSAAIGAPLDQLFWNALQPVPHSADVLEHLHLIDGLPPAGRQAIFALARTMIALLGGAKKPETT
jgi:hypothetical protein